MGIRSRLWGKRDRENREIQGCCFRVVPDAVGVFVGVLDVPAQEPQCLRGLFATFVFSLPESTPDLSG